MADNHIGAQTGNIELLEGAHPLTGCRTANELMWFDGDVNWPSGAERTLPTILCSITYQYRVPSIALHPLPS